MLLQEVINEIEYDKIDMSELSFILAMYIKTHIRTTEIHINPIEFRKMRLLKKMLEETIETLRN